VRRQGQAPPRTGAIGKIRGVIEPDPPEELARSLSGVALPGERVKGLLRMGLTYGEIARATGVANSTVRGWGAGKPLRHTSFIALDDLRTVAYILLDRGATPTDARQWLVSRRPDGQRPLDLVAADPEAAIAAADAFGPASGRLADPLTDPLGDPGSEHAELTTTSALVGPDGLPLTTGTEGYRRIETTFRGISDELIRRLAEQPHLMHEMHWRDFEELVAELFSRDGFDVTLTPGSGDRGVDLFAARRTGLGTLLYVVECKRYEDPIGPNLVRELGWVVERHRANVGVLATTSRFTVGAVEETRSFPLRVSLADFRRISGWLSGEPIL